jgi:hypothetical protein
LINCVRGWLQTQGIAVKAGAEAVIAVIDLRGSTDLEMPIATRRRTSTYAPTSANTRLR